MPLDDMLGGGDDRQTGNFAASERQVAREETRPGQVGELSQASAPIIAPLAAGNALSGSGRDVDRLPKLCATPRRGNKDAGL